MWESCILPAGEEITDGHRVESCLNPEVKELQGELDGADLGWTLCDQTSGGREKVGYE